MLSSDFFSENVSFFFFSQFFQIKITTYLSLHLRLFPLIFQELVSDVKIDLLIAVCGDLPLGITVQIREIGICLVGMIDLCHMCHIAVGQHLTVNALAADDVDAFLVVFFSSSRSSSMECTTMASFT